ncbi:Trm112 family protein [Aestuariibacter sp. A3R04]|uniref:Trm112 family protein n=1 Tax=Aestuariibacter sp. A3R04 TaxID=2841571 RepID=UPI001C08DAED|nr:Trm112 family protein [Aestuariibacter sp. A3R04]MBU3022994.1 Trm112 family protein [Aestuariibacter sp. A3R04]
MSLDVKLLDVLACPVCKGKLTVSRDKSQLLCRFDRLSFAVEAGIPVLIEAHAKQLTLDEMDELQR